MYHIVIVSTLGFVLLYYHLVIITPLTLRLFVFLNSKFSSVVVKIVSNNIKSPSGMQCAGSIFVQG